MSQMPKGRKKHLKENVNVTRIQKNESLNMNRVGDKTNLFSTLFSKMKGRSDEKKK